MAGAVVVGAGVAGLGSALALARSGHAVTVFERDGASMPASPDAAFEEWTRRGAPQARHSHAFLARLRNLLRDRHPDVLEALLAAGATEVDFTAHPPPALAPLAPAPGDEDLVGLACRRTTFEWVLRRQVQALPAVQVVAGTVEGVVARDRRSGVPHVGGVRLAGGGVVEADLVVDAGGRRSQLPGWLRAVGAAPVPEAEEDTGIIYSSRFYRVREGGEPGSHGLVVGDLTYLKYACFPGDNGTMSITFGIPSDDAELRRLLHPGPFTAAAEALPAVRSLMDRTRCQPVTGVEAMGGLVNRRRRFVVDGQPLATGVYAVGDSSVCTNPIYGRGCALGMVQAQLLADTLAEAGTDPVGGAVAFARATRDEIEPWYDAAVAQDRNDRRADAEDEAEPGAPVGVASLMRHGLLPAARRDPHVFRAFMRGWNLLDAPGTMMRDPEVVARVLAAWQDRAGRVPPPPLGPDRADLLRLVAGAA